jgi:putative membrane protein
MGGRRRASWVAALTVAVSTAATGSPSGGASAFLRAVIQTDDSEIMLGGLAARDPTASLAVQRYGRTLARDHTQNLEEALALARIAGIEPPMDATSVAMAEDARLRRLRRRAFDRAFLRYMIRVHRADIDLFERQAERRDGDISRFAEASLPMLRGRARVARELAGR